MGVVTVLCRWYDCYSDEHFLPVLLTMHGKETETYCSGNLMHVDWAKGGAHPTSYTSADLTVDKCDDHLIVSNTYFLE